MTKRRGVLLSVTLDLEAAEILRQIAAEEAEENRSFALRKIIREAGLRRGLRVERASAAVPRGRPAAA